MADVVQHEAQAHELAEAGAGGPIEGAAFEGEEGVEHAGGHLEGAEGMGEAGVGGAGEGLVGEAELLDVAQPLEEG